MRYCEFYILGIINFCDATFERQQREKLAGCWRKAYNVKIIVTFFKPVCI